MITSAIFNFMLIRQRRLDFTKTSWRRTSGEDSPLLSGNANELMVLSIKFIMWLAISAIDGAVISNCPSCDIVILFFFSAFLSRESFSICTAACLCVFFPLIKCTLFQYFFARQSLREWQVLATCAASTWSPPFNFNKTALVSRSADSFEVSISVSRWRPHQLQRWARIIIYTSCRKRYF